jgi:hypothetical protein
MVYTKFIRIHSTETYSISSPIYFLAEHLGGNPGTEQLSGHHITNSEGFFKKTAQY